MFKKSLQTQAQHIHTKQSCEFICLTDDIPKHSNVYRQTACIQRSCQRGYVALGSNCQSALFGYRFVRFPKAAGVGLASARTTPHRLKAGYNRYDTSSLPWNDGLGGLIVLLLFTCNVVRLVIGFKGLVLLNAGFSGIRLDQSEGG